MRIFPNIAQGNAASRSLSSTGVGAYSLASALITVVLHADDTVFNIPEASGYYLDMVRIHIALLISRCKN